MEQYKYSTVYCSLCNLCSIEISLSVIQNKLSECTGNTTFCGNDTAILMIIYVTGVRAVFFKFLHIEASLESSISCLNIVLKYVYAAGRLTFLVLEP